MCLSYMPRGDHVWGPAPQVPGAHTGYKVNKPGATALPITRPEPTGWLTTVLGGSRYLFFVLSGFVIFGLLFQDYQSHGSID
jgi:peptidoglycan/LPS O-acetylase OafA/YrhL